MSKETYVEGDILEFTGGNNLSYAKEGIINSGSQVIQNGKENGVTYGTNKPAPKLLNSVLLKKFLIHFRHSSTYNGEFGFDWMRDEYIYPITLVNGTMKELCVDIAKLKTEYKTTDVVDDVSSYDKDYYCSFLNLMLNQEATLDLEVEELEVLSSDSTGIIFESSNPDLTITPATVPLNTLIAAGKKNKPLGGIASRDYYLATNQIKVKCNKAFTKNEQIKVFAKLKDTTTGSEDKLEVGKMMVMKNDQIYKLKARFVEVRLRGKITANNLSLGTENALDFSAGTSVASIPSAGISNSIPLTLSTTISNWKSHIENNENDFKNKFNQALIKYERLPDYKTLRVDFRNFTVGTSSGGTGIDKIKKSITSIDIDAIACDMEEFLNGLHEMYATENTPETGIIVFLLPIIIRYSNPPAGVRVDYLDGFSDDIFSSGKYIMMTKYSSSLRKETLVHEAAHTLGLFHSFQTATKDHGRDVTPDYTFEYATTDNIMDYSVNVNTFWKWQWKKMKLDTTDLELIP